MVIFIKFYQRQAKKMIFIEDKKKNYISEFHDNEICACLYFIFIK